MKLSPFSQETFVFSKNIAIDIKDLLFIIQVSKLFTPFCHHSFHHHTNHFYKKCNFNMHTMLLLGGLAKWGSLLCLPHLPHRPHLPYFHSNNIITTVQVFFLCTMGLFVHLLFSVSHSYSDKNSVKTLEQIKTLIILVNHACVHGYMICPLLLYLGHWNQDVVWQKIIVR